MFDGVVVKAAVIGGTGDMGFGLAVRLAHAGVEVVIGSRKVERAIEAAEKIKAIVKHGNVSGKINPESVKNCDFVFFSIPYEGLREIAQSVAEFIEKNSVVVSCVVPFVENKSSAAEELAELLPAGTRLVSALHTVSASLLTDLDKPVDSDTFLFGDDKEAKKQVAKLLSKIAGLRPVDGGPLKNSKYGELFTRFLVGINKRYGVSSAGIRITWLDDSTVYRRWEA
ncbi:MAG: NADPH-dependent F420 reductase [Candidatus Caldarchaeum sp.]|nr:NADPH-dependent F420 reductase [Candidatus Caldarchaeum sp.]